MLTLVGVIVTIAALSLAQDVLIPLALAMLFSFLLAPLVKWLERRHLPRVLAVLVVVSVAAGGIGALGYVVVRQAVDLTANLPQYQDNIVARVRALRGGGEGGLGKMAENIQNLQKEIKEVSEEAEPPDPGEEKPVKVAVVAEPASPLDWIAGTLGPLLVPLTTGGIVLILVIFMLLSREDLRDRMIHLLGRGDLNLTTQALQDASSRISRYLLMQLVVNATYGIPVAIGLYFIGVPNAVLWGLLATVLRFIPYVGPIVGAAMPIAVSLAVFQDWTHPGLVVGLFIVLEVWSNNVMEPWLYGSSTGMSSLAVLVAAVFWTWLWGPIGLLLATPLTACLVAFGKHVPQLEFLSVLFGDQPVLEPTERFYQRLLANDQEDAAGLAEKSFDTSGSLVATYDALLVPALQMAEQDHLQGRLDEDRRRTIFDGVRAIAELLAEHAELAAAGASALPATGAQGEALPEAHGVPVLCLPARDEADEIVGAMLALVLNAQGFEAEAVTVHALVSERIERVAEKGAHAVCISALPPSATVHARYLCKRLRSRYRDLRLFVGLWHSAIGAARGRERIACGSDVAVVTTLTDAVQEMLRSRSLLERSPGEAAAAAAG